MAVQINLIVVVVNVNWQMAWPHKRFPKNPCDIRSRLKRRIHRNYNDATVTLTFAINI